MNELEEKLAKEVAKQVPIKEVYTDIVQPSAKSTGDVLSIIPIGANALLAPIWEFIYHREADLREVQMMLDMRLDLIADEYKEEPETYVAVPALMALTYCMDSKELREMYANLLSKAMDTRKDVHVFHMRDVHPYPLHRIKPKYDENKYQKDLSSSSLKDLFSTSNIKVS